MTSFQQLIEQNKQASSLPSILPFLQRRPRRNRKSAAIRSLVQETHLHPNQLVLPLFVLEGENKKEPIASMPGIERKSIDLIIDQLKKAWSLGIRATNLFAYVPEEKKDALGTEAIRPGNLISQAIHTIKKELPDLCVMADVALDPYTTHGHDGVLGKNNTIDNDRSLEILAQMALLLADSGADVIAPSDMMDGRVAMIRHTLDQADHTDVNILSYTVKYTSAFYGPFRQALGSAPKVGDKKTYQLNPANVREAVLEAELDEEEGADMLMVKPALPYLDVIRAFREQTHLPICAYHVSGEYSMVMAAGERGWIDPDQALMESLMSIRRAGADFILTYAAERVASRLTS